MANKFDRDPLDTREDTPDPFPDLLVGVGLAAGEREVEAAPAELALPENLPPPDSLPHPGWSIKEQEVTDKHTGVTLRFGRHRDDSNTVFLQMSVPGGNGATIVFQRGGEVLQVIPHPLAESERLPEREEAGT